MRLGETEPRAEFLAMDGPYAEGGSSAGVPADPLREGVAVTASRFGLLSWAEGGKARVIVSADTEAKDGTRTEKPVATFVLAPGESREVVETERFGAAHIVVVVSMARPGSRQ